MFRVWERKSRESGIERITLEERLRIIDGDVKLVTKRLDTGEPFPSKRVRVGSKRWCDLVEELHEDLNGK